MTKSRMDRAARRSKAAEEVKAIVDEFVRKNPRLEFLDSASFSDTAEAAEKEQDLADIYRKHLGLQDPN